MGVSKFSYRETEVCFQAPEYVPVKSTSAVRRGWQLYVGTTPKGLRLHDSLTLPDMSPY